MIPLMVIMAVSTELVLSVIVGLGLLGGVGYGVKAFYERKLLQANANSGDATATATVAAAARELIDPLRKELANERAEHALGVDMERKKMAEVQLQLDAALLETQAIRQELTWARSEMEKLRAMVDSIRVESDKYKTERDDYRVRLELTEGHS